MEDAAEGKRVLSREYYNASVPGSYGGARGVLKRGKDRGVSGDRVKKWLKGEDAYTLHRPVRRRFRRRKTIVSGPGQQWQCDLMDLSSLSKYNGGMKFVLTCIDVFSKVGYAYVLKNKSSGWVLKGLKAVFKKAGEPPVKLQTDKGSEFLNKPVQDFLRGAGVKHFVSENDDVKCAIVERWNRTLKERLWRYFTHKRTLSYVSVLPRLVSSYNDSYHRSIGMAPSAVNAENRESVWRRLYESCASPKSGGGGASLKVGSIVRISKARMLFRKGYLPGWSTETFEVTEVLRTTPTTYRLRDESGEEIAGSFYGAELEEVEAPPADKIYAIEKVLQRRGDEIKVRWEGYPSKFDSWIKAGALLSGPKKKR